jgi:diaminopimelate decarboxylase
MRHFAYRDGVLFAQDVPLARIAQEVGTPVYVYAQATLERHFLALQEAFSAHRPLIAFAVKANGNLAVLALLAGLGAGADVVSAGEIERALAAGIAPERIIFSGVGKTAEELRYALGLGLYQINVESPAELVLLESLAKDTGTRPVCALRVNPDIGAGGHSKITTGQASSKFGVSLEQAEALYAQAAASSALRPVGLAMHIGSQITDLQPLERAIGLMRAAAERLRARGLPLLRLDLGGGLAAPYAESDSLPGPLAYAQAVTRALAGFNVELALEPGRVIAANAGVLLTRVIRVQERAERRIIVLDAGMNDLLRPALYDARHEILPVRAVPNAGLELVDLVGPVCESSDCFAADIRLPALAAGDLACIMTSGAYGASMSSSYNARPLVPEVLVHGAHYALVRRRQSVAEQMRLETVPSWLQNRQA